jgi:hypothetical protein
MSGYDPTACPAFRTLTRGWTNPRTEALARALPGVVARALKSTRLLLKSFD